MLVMLCLALSYSMHAVYSACMAFTIVMHTEHQDRATTSYVSFSTSCPAAACVQHITS